MSKVEGTITPQDFIDGKVMPIGVATDWVNEKLKRLGLAPASQNTISYHIQSGNIFGALVGNARMVWIADLENFVLLRKHDEFNVNIGSGESWDTKLERAREKEALAEKQVEFA